MSYWDGTRWSAAPPSPARSTRRTLTDAAATAAMIVVTIGFVIPWVSTGATGPALGLSPYQGPAGTTVQVSATGFPAKATVALAWDGASTGMPRTTANGHGTFRVKFTVPAKALAGGHAVSATTTVSSTASPSSTASATFMVVLAATSPSPAVTADASPSPLSSATPVASSAPTPTPTATATAVLSSPTPSPTPTATPTPTSATGPSGGSAFVTRCGLALCLGGSTWPMYAASDLGGLGDPDARSALAVTAGLNTIRIVNFLDEHGAPSTAPYDAWHWARVDRVIASAAAHGLHVLLDLSTYRNLLWNAGLNPYTVDWQPFIQFVATRVNTVSGVRYGNDQAIALVAFAGEVEPINTSANTRGVTTSQVTSFYSRSFSEWKALDPNHLVSTGGLLQLDWASGIDWRTIFGLSTDDVCSIHDYSDADRTITTPAVSSYCASIGRPWITEEFGWNQSVGDATRASDFQSMYSTQVTYRAAGVGFWNLGTQVGTSTYDVNTGTPLTWATVLKNAP